MSRAADIRAAAEMIVKANDGRVYFNFKDASKIIGCDADRMARMFLEAGILVKKSGRDKRISAFDIAEVMCYGRVSPIEGRM